jgi:hypothetical protein
VTMPRPLVLIVAGILLFGIAVWVATTPAVIMPSASMLAGCFEPVELLPPPPSEAGVTLVRDKALEAPSLVVTLTEAANVRLEGGQPLQVSEGAPAEQKITLCAQQRMTFPTRVRGVATLEKGFVELRRTDGSRFLVRPRARFGLHPAETYMAQLALPAEVKTVSAEGEVQLPSGSKVEIVLPESTPPDNQVVVQHIERLLVGPLMLPRVTAALLPDVRPDQEAAPYLATKVLAPGLDLDLTKSPLRACLWVGKDPPGPIPISRVGTSGLGAAELVLGLPSDPFSWFEWRRGRTAGLAVADTAGRYVGVGQFVYPSRSWALVLATGITLLLFLGLLWVRAADKAVWKIWCMGLFLGEDGQPSLSLFQILLWTVVTVWALLFVFFCTGNLIAMTQQVMVLLGFAGAGSLAARWVATSRAMSSQRSSDRKNVRFWALLENERGYFDLFKLQLFMFTLLIAAYVAFRVVRQSAFPIMDTEFLLLMGVSNGLYVGSKVGQSSDLFALARQRKLEWDGLRIRVADLEKHIADLEAQSSDLNVKIGAETDLAKKQELTDGKVLHDRRLTNAREELAQARTDRDAKEADYKKAIDTFAKSSG